MVSNIITGGLKLVSQYQPHPKFWCGLSYIDVWFAWKITNTSMTYKSRYKKETNQREGLDSIYNWIPEQKKSNS